MRVCEFDQLLKCVLFSVGGLVGVGRFSGLPGVARSKRQDSHFAKTFWNDAYFYSLIWQDLFKRLQLLQASMALEM